MIFVGLISYSLYLWHWPLIAYTKVFFGNPSQVELAMALAVSLPMSIFAFKYIESPARGIQGKSSVLVVFVLLLVLMATYVCGKLIRKMDGFQNREIATVLNFNDDWSYSDGLYEHKQIKNFFVTNTEKIPKIIFIGDSHIEQYHARVMDISQKTHTPVGFFTRGGCFMSVGKGKDDKDCPNATEELDVILKNPAVDTLVLAQKWGDYMENNLLGSGVDAYLFMIDKFLKVAKNRKVYVLLDNPWSENENGEFDIWKHIGSRYNLREKFDKLNVFVSMPKDQKWRDGNDFIINNFGGKVIFIDTGKHICPGGLCDLKNYRDDDHLRASYVKDHAFWIDQVFSHRR
mgnify:CR=1 FL=1